MARQQGVVIQNKFTGGLNTEFTALNYPENAATETYNCVFDYTGRVSRRKGFDFEDGYVLQETPLSDLSAFTEHTWNSAGGTGDVTLFVQQKGDTLYFYDISSSTQVGVNKKAATVSLSTFLVDGSNRVAGNFPCQYTTVNGDLIVVNPACNPFSISYAIATDTISTTEIFVRIRDFRGIEDGLATFFRPVTTVATLKTSNPKHYYNLLNQGWHVGDALAKWDSALTNLPSNGDYIGLFRGSDTNSFDVARVTANSNSNTPAPKGHFIVDVGDVDRTAAMVGEGFTGAAINEGVIQVPQSQGSAIGNYSNLSNAFDNQISSTYASSKVSGAYIGKDYGASLPVKVTSATIYPASIGILEDNDVSSVVLRLYGKTTGTPSSATDGTLLGTTTLSATNTDVTGGDGDYVTDMSNAARAFDSSSTTYASKTGTFAYVGKTWAKGSPAKVTSAVVTPYSSNTPFVQNLPDNATVTLQLYGKNGALPSSSTDGTVLGSTTRTITTVETDTVQTTGTAIRAAFSSSSYAFDTSSSTGDNLYGSLFGSSFSSSIIGYLGRNYSSVNGIKVNSCVIKTSVQISGTYSGRSIRLYARLYGRNSTAPTSPTNGTVLDGYSTLVTSGTSTTINVTLSSSSTTKYDYVWVAYEAEWSRYFGGYGNMAITITASDIDIKGVYDVAAWSLASATIASSSTAYWEHTWVRASHNTASSTYILPTVIINATRLAFSTNTVSIASSNTTTQYRSVWITVSSASASNVYRLGEVYFQATFTSIDSSGAVGTDEKNNERFSTCATFSGRVWYSGMSLGANASSIFFSRILTNKQYGQCHQEQDPTSEYYSILLPTDGGVITIPEIGIVKKLFSLKTALLAFSSNGVWVISGSNGRAFSADDFQVKKISGLGSSSPLSFVDYKGYPMWFGEDGIFTVIFDPRFETYEVQSISDESIKSFFLGIPSSNRKYVKGTYNLNDDVLTWIYNDSSILEQTDFYKYNSMLSWSGRNQAFYPWTVDDTGPVIRGINYTFDTEGTDKPVIKYTITVNKDVDEDYLLFGGVSSDSYTDWLKYSEFTTVSSDAKDYESYFITGYRPDGETQRVVQANYLFVFLDTEPTSSCKVQAIFDYSSSGNSGKQNMFQEAYNQSVLNRKVNYTRLRMRGSGRSLQFKFKSTSGKPFTILGWSIYETGNANV